MNADQANRVLVIGGGVSGISSSIRLRHHGFAVTLVERAEFPREKICGCCLGAAGLAALDSIGLGQGVRQRGLSTKFFVGYLQTQLQPDEHSTDFKSLSCRLLPLPRFRWGRGRARRAGVAEVKRHSFSVEPLDDLRCGPPIRLPIKPGVAISRSVLDTYLMEAAIEAGVEVRQPHEAQVVDSDRRAVTVRHRRPGDSWTTTDEYAFVIIATGLTGVFQAKPVGDLDRSSQPRWELPWIRPPHGPLGAATHLPGDHALAKSWPIVDGEIQMVCGDDGYVGLVRLPGGAIDIAAALPSRTKHRPQTNRPTTPRSASTPSARIVELLRSHPDFADRFLSDLDEWLQKDAFWMTAPPLRRTRQVGRGRAVAIGDCARYVEPLTGEGMTWGMESGIAVADLCNEVVGSACQIDLASQWARRLDRLQPKRRVVCSSVTGALRSRAVRQLMRVSLRHCGWMAGPLTRGLASGPKFAPTDPFHRG